MKIRGKHEYYECHRCNKEWDVCMNGIKAIGYPIKFGFWKSVKEYFNDCPHCNTVNWRFTNIRKES